MSDHPYFKLERPSIPTRAMEDGLTKISSAIEAEYRGAGFHSLTRFGKSRLGSFIVANTQWLERKYYGFRVTLPVDVKVGSGAFYEYVYGGLQAVIPSRLTPSQKLERLIALMVTRANALGTTLIIFVLDEANRLPGEEFEHLVTIDNALTLRGYTLFVVSLFQDNYTSSKREAINTLTVTPQVRARFFTRYHQMHGIRGPDDIRVFLQRLEEETEYPPGSGISYPRHVAPKAYEGNFRMANSAPLIWKCGCDALATAGKQNLPEWPMKPFELITFYIVTRILPRPGFTDLTKADIEEALDFSDLVHFDGVSGKVEDS